MMDEQEVDFFVDQLLNRAVADFRSTNQYKLLREKLEQMDSDCDTVLATKQRAFAQECFDLLLDVSGQEEEYVYRRGLQDGVRILKQLGVLA